MKTLVKLLGLAALCVLPLTVSLKANPVLITTLNIGAFPPYGDSTVQTGITNAITSWNVTHDPDLPLTGIGPTPNVKVDSFPNGTISITLSGLGAYNYIFMHWGGPNADSSYNNPQLYYLGGTTNWTFNAPTNNGQTYGLSFYSLYSPTTTNVPDGSTTALMLGLGLLGLGALARRK
jgi:hypothetical protein